LLSDVSKQVVDDWIALRKAKKAAITRTAVEGIISEAKKAGYTLEQVLSECCSRGWAGFKAVWLDEKQKNGGAYESSYTKSMREKYEVISPRIAAKNPNSKRIDANQVIYGGTGNGSKLIAN